MVFAKARPAGPSNAERIRSVVAAAGSLSLTTNDNTYDLFAMHSMDRSGRLLLHAPAESPLAVEAVCAPHGVLVALLEFTDIAPTAVRDRVRARATLAGRLTPSETRTAAGVLVLRLDAVRASIQRHGPVEHVGPDDLRRAEPDVLASAEAAMLHHLDDDDRYVVAQLARLADPLLLRGAVRVVPFALDRHGLTLRYEYSSGHADHRISFPAPVREAAEVGRQVEVLLGRVRARTRRRGADRP
ncbi:DUF2470 domain-containing protein [Streptomyces sp. NPDC048389]|uniref:DUF2470 domain-containing protein n=1 Tax=Streptomyces sp. NPDC048389 TaxID=3154622 RepID=UPI0034536E55